MRNGERGMRNAKVWSFATTLAAKFRIPHSPFPIQLFTAPLIKPPIHHSAGPPLRGSIVAALLVRRLGDDRRHFGRLALVVERDVRQITRVGVPLHSREPGLGDDLD